MKKAKPQPRLADHRLYGRGEVLAVRELDNGGGVFVADIKFGDSERTIRLAQEYWQTSIADLVPTPPRPKRHTPREE